MFAFQSLILDNYRSKLRTISPLASKMLLQKTNIIIGFLVQESSIACVNSILVWASFAVWNGGDRNGI